LGINYNYMQQKTVKITLQCSSDLASEMQEIDLLNTFQSDYNKVELMKLSFEMYKWNVENFPPDRQKNVNEIYRLLSKEIWNKEAQNADTHDLLNINIVDNFPCVDIAPIYCFSLQENGLIAAITKVLIIEEDIPEIANKGVYVQEVYVNTINADFEAIFEFISIPENAIIKLPYVGDAALYHALNGYCIEFYKPVENIASLEIMLTMSQIKCKGLNVVSEIGNLSRNLLSELKDDKFGACLQSLAWLGIIEMNIKVSVYSENELLKSQTIKQNL